MRKSKIVDAIISEAATIWSTIEETLPNGKMVEDIIRAVMWIFDKLGSTCIREWREGATGVLTSSLSLDALLVMRFTAIHLVQAVIRQDQYATVVTKTLRDEPIDLLAMALEDMLVHDLRDMRHFLCLGELSHELGGRSVTCERELYSQVKGYMSLHEARTKLAQLEADAGRMT